MTEDKTRGVAEPPEHPASQSDDESYRDEESFLDGPDRPDNPHHVGAQEDDFTHTADHSHVYHNMMRIGFAYGLPIGAGIVMFIALLLMGTNFLVAFFLGVLTWLAVYGFAKTFFVHDPEAAHGH